MIGDSYYYLKKYDKALKYYEIALSYVDINNTYHLLMTNYLKARLKLKVEFSSELEKNFLETLKFHAENNILAPKCQIEFHLTEYYLKAGSPDSALKHLSDCLKVSEERQFISFLEWEVLNFMCLILPFHNLKQFIKTIFENVRGKINYEWLSDECKKRLATEIENLTDLKLFTFGKTEIWLRGEPIEEDKWVRKKSKIILAYLLTKPDTLLNKDKIIDMFFQMYRLKMLIQFSIILFLISVCCQDKQP
jgi:tetratricopeptide (TPR) repeat protein